jgi:hypothetical protein
MYKQKSMPFIGKYHRKGSLGIPKHGWGNNIKMNIKEMVCEDVN